MIEITSSSAFGETPCNDLNGNITRIDYPSGRYVTYSYDGADRVEPLGVNGCLDIPDDTVSIDNVAYEPFGRVKSFTNGDSVTVNITHDNQYRVSGITAGSLIDRSYSYDYAGNITGITDEITSSKSNSFGYDALHRLTSASGIWGSGSFSYDAVGNRTSKAIGGNTTNYSYPSSSNKLSSSTGAEAASYSYDNRGNITGNGANTFVYNQSGRLTEVKTGTETLLSNLYDGLGRRVKRNDSTANIAYLHDTSGNLISEQNFMNIEYVYLDSMPVIKLEGGQEPSSAMCWDMETSGPCNTGLWGKKLYIVFLYKIKTFLRLCLI